ncbi:MAG: hypothetical protein ACI9LN_000808, partial [Saprospiraceae bacterium]
FFNFLQRFLFHLVSPLVTVTNQTKNKSPT